MHTFSRTPLGRGPLLPPCHFARRSLFTQNEQTHNELRFEQIGLTRPVADALRKAFPNIVKPTRTQTELIPAVLSGKDVLLKDATGSGKSIGILLALLSKPRRYLGPQSNNDRNRKPSIASIVLIPHRDLAYQYLHWTKSLCDTKEMGLGKLDSAIQVMVRGESMPIETQVQKAVDTPPHILVATPQALLEALSLKTPPLTLREITTIVLDEADYLLESVPAKKDKYASIKFARMVARHPTPSRQILDAVYRIARATEYRKHVLAKLAATAGESQPLDRLKSGIIKAHRPLLRPQLIVTSATLKAAFRHSVLAEGRWLTPHIGQLAKIIVHEKKEDVAKNVLGSDGIVHSALVVSEDGTVLNIKGAVDPFPNTSATLPKPALEELPATDEEPSLEDELQPENDQTDEPSMKSTSKPSPFNASAMEAIATMFALEVPRVALMVLSPTASVEGAVREMRALGVNAHGLHIADRERGGAYLLNSGTGSDDNPTLLVATLATVRGLDLPDLAHVFVLGTGALDVLDHDAYTHAAGRVGRFGKGGQVVTVVNQRYLVKRGKKSVVVDEPMRLKGIYQRLDVTPVNVEHFGVWATSARVPGDETTAQAGVEADEADR